MDDGYSGTNVNRPELDRLFKRIYEDNANGRLSDSRFQMLSDDYEQEQEEQAENIDRFISKVRKYLKLDELTPAVLNDMVKAVYVHAPDNSSGHREQQIDIPRVCGNIPPRPCSTTCQTEKRHSQSYAVSRKQLYAVLLSRPIAALFYLFSLSSERTFQQVPGAAPPVNHLRPVPAP